MEPTAQLALPNSVKRLKSEQFDWDLCSVCQTKTQELLVTSKCETSYEKLYNCITQRALWRDETYINVKRLLGNATIEDFKSNAAQWHRACYQKSTHKKGMEQLHQKTLLENHEEVDEENEEQEATGSNPPLTRAHVPVYKKSQCIFCDVSVTRRYPLHRVATNAAGEQLLRAVEISNNEKLRVRLNESMNPADTRAINVLYHKICWKIHVIKKLRAEKVTDSHSSKICNVGNATEMKFIEMVENSLMNGNVLTMSNIESTYRKTCKSNGLEETEMKNRKQIRTLLEEELEYLGVEFTAPKKKRESHRVSLKLTKDVALLEAEEQQKTKDMRKLYSAAKIMRQLIIKEKPWTFSGSLLDNNSNIVPKELLSFYKWCLTGVDEISNANTSNEVHNRATRLSQNLMYECLSPHQVYNKKSENLRHVHEFPIPLAVGVFVHKETRSKQLVHLLHHLGFSVHYNRILQLETQIAADVLRQMKLNSNVFMPRGLIKGRFIYCAADNIDFNEDTSDGKKTLHGTVMVVYQRSEEADMKQSLVLKSRERSLKLPAITSIDVPQHTYVKNLNLATPTLDTTLPLVTHHKTNFDKGILHNTVWLMLQTTTIPTIVGDIDESITSTARDMSDQDGVYEDRVTLPSITWKGCTFSAYNSLLSETKPKTNVHVLPLIPESPTNSVTQFSFMKKFEKINSEVQGTPKRVVVTLDMGLYKPVKQMELADEECKGKWILRPGELHTVMAQLRAIGTYVDGTGIPEAWIESDLFGMAVTKQIIDGKHVRRSIKAHTITLIALYKLYQEAFYSKKENFELKNMLDSKLINIQESMKNGKCIKKAHDDLIKSDEFLKVFNSFEKFDKENHNPNFKVMRQYMQMVENMLLFVKSVRIADWNLHLDALNNFTKYFFALDFLNYSGMMAWYLAEMDELRKTDLETWNEFERGNWVVTKSNVPHSSLGADEALEHENRGFKVTGGLVGITLNENARNRFFLSAAKMSSLASEARIIAGLEKHDSTKHHQEGEKFSNWQHSRVSTLLTILRRTQNPFTYETNDLVNIITKRVMPEEVKKDMTESSKIGQEQYNKFIMERIKTSNKNLWAPIKKLKLNTCRESLKKMKVNMKSGSVVLREDRNLFSRLLMAARSRTEFDLKDVVANYELSVVPRSLFSPDGSILHSYDKSKLLNVIENFASNAPLSLPLHVDLILEQPLEYSVAIVDAMAELHAFNKSAMIHNCLDLANHFIAQLRRKYGSYSELHLIFDTYLENSLKQTTRNRRQRSNSTPVHFHIEAKASLQNIPMKKLLSHEKTKSELSSFLSQCILENAAANNFKVVVAWEQKAEGTAMDVSSLSSSHEEADTKIILHAIHAGKAGAKEVTIYSPDTDVFILALSKFEMLPKNTKVITGHASKKRSLQLLPIHEKLGNLKVKALVGLHALSGADVTGSFFKKGKLSFWKAFQDVIEDILNALVSLGGEETVREDILLLIEQFICQVYCPKTYLKEVGELRWWLFTHKQAGTDTLPPTRSSLHPSILRAHLQAMEWNRCDQVDPKLPSPRDFGWIEENNMWVPVMCTKPPAPTDILELIKCGCTKSKCSSCKCASRRLPCSEMCACEDNPENCDNSTAKFDEVFNNDDNDSDVELDLPIF